MNPLLQEWQFQTTQVSTSVVLPDGCQDLIFCADASGSNCFVSPLANCAYSAPSEAGTAFLGYRFRPGAQIDGKRLLAAVRFVQTKSLSQSQAIDRNLVIDAIDSCVKLDHQISDALAALALMPRVQKAARDCGMSIRSFERMVMKLTFRAPDYWRRLARVRRAALALGSCDGLADIAAAQGYSDQAHMQRDFKRWFGITPSGFRQNSALVEIAQALGYG